MNVEVCKYYNEKVAYINKLVRLLYDDLGECCGGLLHIVLDDGNLEDHNIQWCIEYVNKPENADREDRLICLEIATKMLDLSIEERALIYHMGMGFECEIIDCSNCVIEKGEEFYW